MTKNFEPVEVLEAAGINNFHVDYEKHVVQVNENDLIKLSEYIKTDAVSDWQFEKGA